MSRFLVGFEKRASGNTGAGYETKKLRDSFGKKASDGHLSNYMKGLKRRREEEKVQQKDDRKESKKDHKQRLEDQEKFETADNRPTLVYEGADVVGGKKLDKEREAQDAKVQGTIDKGEQLKGGLADGAPDSAFNPTQLRKGQKVETEHTDDPEQAGEIAKDHLAEDSEYYDKLEKMEKKEASDPQMMLGGLGTGFAAGRRTAGTVSNMISHEGSKVKNEELARTLAMGTAPLGAIAGILAGSRNRQKIRSTLVRLLKDRDLSNTIDAFTPLVAGTAGGIAAGAGTGALTGLRKSDTTKRRIQKEKTASEEKTPLNTPMKSDRPEKKRKVYVKTPSGNTKTIHYGHTSYKHNYSDGANKNFRARHNCDSAKDKLTARYWACKDLWPAGSKKGTGETEHDISKKAEQLKGGLADGMPDSDFDKDKTASKMKEVAAVAVIKDGKILMGKRRDNGRWTNPGGHIEEGEAPLDGAIRELYEEAGVECRPDQMKHLATEIVEPMEGKGKIRVHCYKVNLGDRTPTSMKDDPDNEVFRWHWINASDRNNAKIYNNLHVPADKNVLLKALGMTQEKSAALYRNYRMRLRAG